MGLSRRVLLALSESHRLRKHASHWRFVKKAAQRFMPGDRFDDAAVAARQLQQAGIGVVFTELGENVTTPEAADAVTQRYLDALARIDADKLDGELSVKLTQLGLDVDEQRCQGRLRLLVERASHCNRFVWVDMEQHRYLEPTLALYRRLLGEFQNVGVCLQAYLHRTSADLDALMPHGGGIRLVKGAYREPAGLAFQKKRDVDASFRALAVKMLAMRRGGRSPRLVFGTHDLTMVKAISDHATRNDVARDAFEFHLLYGIQRAQQLRLAKEGYRVRVLISYGDQWFAWYMRRLAERPANVFFALRAMFS